MPHVTLRKRFTYSTETRRSGGFSDVYRGVDLGVTPPREVAVKIIEGRASEDQGVPYGTFFDREVESLLSLEHPNIVQLFDAGLDESGRYFLVLEWIDNDLSTWLKARGEVLWEDFLNEVGLPLADALSFAHQRMIIHRDVKPGNVLLKPDGTVRLADFGISKIKNSLTDSPHTTVDFISRPYAPPERDSTFSRDVFGLGVLLVGAISGHDLTDYPQIDVALRAMDVPSEISELLGRCVSLSPEKRPKDASILHNELDALLRARVAARKPRAKIQVRVSRAVVRKWSELTGRPPADCHDAIFEELGAGATLRSADDTATLGQLHGKSLYLAGVNFSFKAVVEAAPDSIPYLDLVFAVQQRVFEVDRAMRQNLQLTGYEFVPESSISAVTARSTMQQLIRELEEFEIKRDEELNDREDGRLLTQWKRQLDARAQWEIRRQDPVRYRSIRYSGSRATFGGLSDIAGLEVGQLRRVDIGTPSRIVIGEVDDIGEDSVVLWFEDSPKDLPTRGTLLLDSTAAEIKIRRERSAINALIHRSPELVSLRLRDVIIDPTVQESPVRKDIKRWFTPDLDDDKREIVSTALGNRGMFVVEGPPGTGKTTFIAELVAQTLERSPAARILISSQTNVALDNALVKTTSLVSSARVVRLADRMAQRVADDARPLLLESQLEVWCKDTRRRADKQFASLCKLNGIKTVDVDAAALLRSLAQWRTQQRATQQQHADLMKKLDDSELLAKLPMEERDSLAQQGRKLNREIKSKERLIKSRLSVATALKSDLMEGAAELTPEELLRRAGSVLDKFGKDAWKVELISDWKIRLETASDGFLDAIVDNAQIIGGTCIGIARHRAVGTARFDLCIVDEASKATATETLVPLVRAESWILVGDQRQLPPFQEEALSDVAFQSEFELDKIELGRTLFDRMISHLPTDSHAMLSTQRRMTRAIGELVSSCFYDGKLLSKGPDPLPAILGVLTKPVTWFSTSRLSGKHESRSGSQGTSFVNAREVDRVSKVLSALAFAYRSRKLEESLSVIVVAPYSGQIAQLQRVVDTCRSDLPKCNIEVNSVDAVQGREADLVILSTVRSNADHRVGFLDSDKRANVALSRARRGLVIVGDAEFLASADSPFQSVLGFINQHPELAAIEELT